MKLFIKFFTFILSVFKKYILHRKEIDKKFMITSININESCTKVELNELIAHKPRMVRFPVRNHFYKNQFNVIEKLLKHKILPLLVFDVGAGTNLWKKQIDLYIGEWKANVCYEVLNEQSKSKKMYPKEAVFRTVFSIINKSGQL